MLSLDSDLLILSFFKEISFLSFSDDDVLLYISFWTRVLMDKFGVVVRYKRFFESVIKEWSLLVLFEECFKEISVMFLKVVFCFKNLDFDLIEEIKV